MKRSFVVAAALLALGACQSTSGLSEGERTNWECAGEKDFSLRRVSYGIEVFAAGQTYRLDPVAGAEGQYSNGTVTLTEAGGNTTLAGVTGGPFESCERKRSDWWLDLW